MNAPKRRLSQLGEFGWLKQLLPRLYWPTSLNPHLCIGAGDDAGVLRITPGRVLVMTTDALVEGVHFERRWFSPRDLGEKLLAINLSDLAAMGKVKPTAVVITAALPGDTPVDSVDKFYQGLKSCAQRWKVGFLGGDTIGSRKGWFVSATLMGEAKPNELIRRKGARAGDLLAVIGPLGLAAAGLEVLQTGRKGAGWTRPLVDAFSRPQPMLDVGAILGSQGWATSMMDVSDGLEASVCLLSEASQVGVGVELDEYPIPSPLKRWASFRRRDPKAYVLKGGEDYALIFTVPPAKWSKVQGRIPGVRRIGRVYPASQGCWASWGRKKVKLSSYGYAHFKNR